MKNTENKIKTCEKCKYYTGIQCHGFGDYWGECKKNKNTLFCYDDMPCLQDKKNLINLYYKQKETIDNLEYIAQENSTYKTRYEIKCRTAENYRRYWYIAQKYIPKEKRKKYRKELLNKIKNDI